jgi:hypothetical protein
MKRNKLVQVVLHDSNNHHNDEIEKFLDAPCQMSLPIKTFSPKEVSQIIKKNKRTQSTWL